MGNLKLNNSPLTIRVYDEQEVSRKDMMKALEVGESLIFVCAPGQALTRLQAGISGSFRGTESMAQEGLEQQRGLMVFEGEVSTAITRVTRVRPPR